jgi:hypothetical protein
MGRGILVLPRLADNFGTHHSSFCKIDVKWGQSSLGNWLNINDVAGAAILYASILVVHCEKTGWHTSVEYWFFSSHKNTVWPMQYQSSSSIIRLCYYWMLSLALNRSRTGFGRIGSAALFTFKVTYVVHLLFLRAVVVVVVAAVAAVVVAVAAVVDGDALVWPDLPWIGDACS